MSAFARDVAEDTKPEIAANDALPRQKREPGAPTAGLNASTNTVA